ncbi:hypothetical protein [Vibrio fluvialis]|uniref:hypothetical protein n=1 Tax=Vibrio fluvialis TaxID=676 RepID=UPI001C9CB44F|nr:hypothetical protein [Vibrio fluvialis]MBY8157109.1 hypothetical protein [Vibrio fluvialis]MCG6410401.1 hypothetical protein [Vibrio fluvialis]MDT8865864.1 hypothetical protein [Vibrio fluvialis]MDT8873632.1 hypothetical protein [Vibrio fluvialis]
MIELKDTDFIISDVTVSNLTPNFYNEAINGKGQALSRGMHRLGVKFKVTLEDQYDIKRFNALMLRIRGRLNPFYLSVSPDNSYNNPLYTEGAAMLSHSVGIGQNKMMLATASGDFVAGSVFQFPNDDKIYTLLDDARPNREIEFFPASRFDHTEKEILNLNPRPLLRLSDDQYEIKLENATEYQFTAMEIL